MPDKRTHQQILDDQAAFAAKWKADNDAYYLAQKTPKPVSEAERAAHYSKVFRSLHCGGSPLSGQPPAES